MISVGRSVPHRLTLRSGGDVPGQLRIESRGENLLDTPKGFQGVTPRGAEIIAESMPGLCDATERSLEDLDTTQRPGFARELFRAGTRQVSSPSVIPLQVRPHLSAKFRDNERVSSLSIRRIKLRRGERLSAGKFQALLGEDGTALYLAERRADVARRAELLKRSGRSASRDREKTRFVILTGS